MLLRLYDNYTAILGCRLLVEEIDGVFFLNCRIKEHQRFLEFHHFGILYDVLVGKPHFVNDASVYQEG